MFYGLTVFVGSVEHSFFFVQFRLTNPRKGCKAEPGTKNESMPSSILRHGSRRPAIAQLFERSVVVVGGDSTTEQVEGPVQ